MSFSGFVFDMIGRNKANREVLNLRRERMKDQRERMYKVGGSQPRLNMTLAEFEHIQKQTKEKEKREQGIRLRYTCIFLASTFAAFVLLWAAFKLLL